MCIDKAERMSHGFTHKCGLPSRILACNVLGDVPAPLQRLPRHCVLSDCHITINKIVLLHADMHIPCKTSPP